MTRIDELLEQMTLDERAALTGGGTSGTSTAWTASAWRR